MDEALKQQMAELYQTIGMLYVQLKQNNDGIIGMRSLIQEQDSTIKKLQNESSGQNSDSESDVIGSNQTVSKEPGNSPG